MRVFVVAAALAACSGTTHGTDKPGGEPAAMKDAAERARGIAGEVYGALRKGHGDTAQTLLATDAFVVGPGAGDVFASRSDAVVAAGKRFELTDKHRVRSRDLIGAASVSGTSAWIVDQIEVDKVPYTVAAVLADVDDIWYVVALHIGKVGGGGSTPVTLSGGAAGGASDAVALARAGAEAPEQFLEQLADSSYVAVLGPGKRDYTRGRKRIARLWKKTHAERKPFPIHGDVRAGVTPDGVLAWVMANTGDGEQAGRAFWIYERSSQGEWRLVAMQRAP